MQSSLPHWAPQGRSYYPNGVVMGGIALTIQIRRWVPQKRFSLLARAAGYPASNSRASEFARQGVHNLNDDFLLKIWLGLRLFIPRTDCMDGDLTTCFSYREVFFFGWVSLLSTCTRKGFKIAPEWTLIPSVSASFSRDCVPFAVICGMSSYEFLLT